MSSELKIRSEFDDILLNHAAECGTKVFQETKVLSFEFVGSRPTSATYAHVSGKTGTIAFDYLVDASGRNGLMSTKYLKNRRMNPTLKNVAVWGYWAGGGCYMPGTHRSNSPYFEALTGK